MLKEGSDHLVGIYHKGGVQHYLWQNGHFNYTLTHRQSKDDGRFPKIQNYPDHSMEDIHKELLGKGYQRIRQHNEGTEIMHEDIKNLIDQVHSGDKLAMQQTLNTIMTSKVAAAIENMKVDIADRMFNGAQEE